MNYWKALKIYIKRIFYKEVSKEINQNELLVRAIVHPLYCSSDGKLKAHAFMPAPDKKEVSLLRHLYTNDSFCKNHGASLRMREQTYKGLCTFKANSISELNKISNENIAILVASPIDEDGNYVEEWPVFRINKGLPMHTDLIYSAALTKGAVQTKFRKYASELIKLSTFHLDPFPDSPDWRGQKLA